MKQADRIQKTVDRIQNEREHRKTNHPEDLRTAETRVSETTK